MSLQHLRIASLALVIGLAAGPVALTQEEEEPSLFGDAEEEGESIEAEEDVPVVNAGRSVPEPPLSKTLDFERWREMSGRERWTFVEGAVLTLESLATDLRASLPSDGRTPPDQLAFLVKFVGKHHPKRPPSAYLTEMDRIYLTAAGQKMSIHECFLKGFQRLNRR